MKRWPTLKQTLRSVIARSFLVFTILIAGVSLILPIIVDKKVSASSDGWLAQGNPVIDSRVLSPDYTIPYSYNYNTDCDVRDFNVITRVAKSGQSELRHTGTCAVQTARGMTDGVYLDAGTPAGRFSRTVERIPSSKALVAFNTIVNSMSIQAVFYDGIIPTYNLATGEVTYTLTGSHKLTDQAGNEYLLRPGSIAYDPTGRWMIAESFKGYIRVDLVTRQVIPFAPPTSPQNNPGQAQYVAISSDGKYAAISVGNTYFRIYDVETCTPVPAAPNGPVSCQFKDVATFINATFSNYRVGVYLRFASSELITFVAAHTHQLGYNERLSVRMVPNGQITEDINYLALGDSFSSGEGTFSYELGTDSASPENKCHLGINSYPYMVARTLYANSNFHSVACSGARINDYHANKQYRDIPENLLGRWLPGANQQKLYLKQAAKPSAITISMVGNDIGFKSKIIRCVSGTDSCFHFREERQSAAAEIKSKFTDLVKLYETIRTDSEGARIYVLGYPQMFNANTPDNQCGNNVWVDAEERVFSRHLVTYLNATIRAATEKAGVQYIDVENSFDGHQLCDSARKAVNGVTRGDDAFIERFGPLGNESFHPNTFGNGLMAQVLLTQSLSLNKEMPPAQPTKTAPSDSSAAYINLIGNAPGGGLFSRATYTTLNGVELLDKANKFIPIIPDISLRPNSTFAAWLNSEPAFLGNLSSDTDGNLNGELTIPQSVPPGYHTLHIYGQNLAGENIDIYKAIYVAASKDDIDGDGVPNAQEKCLAVEPSNIDYDRDNVDDACDSEITEPPADTTAPTIIYTVSPSANENGWHNGDVTVTFTCTDDVSGVASCSEPVIISVDGKDKEIVGTATDKAGNTATVTAIVNLDSAAPVVDYNTDVSPNAAGWFNSDVLINWTSTDPSPSSGTPSQPMSLLAQQEGEETYRSAPSCDAADNCARGSATLKIDKTKPGISYSLSPTPNNNGWSNTAVTVNFACADLISGIQSCSSPVTIDNDGTNQTVTGTAIDNAGNTSTVSVTIDFDSARPTVSDLNIKGTIVTTRLASVGQMFTITALADDQLSGIANGEYYIDTDPGVGQGKPMTFTNNALVAATDFSGVSLGNHKLYIRAKDKAGNYSNAEPLNIFYVGHVVLIK